MRVFVLQSVLVATSLIGLLAQVSSSRPPAAGTAGDIATGPNLGLPQYKKLHGMKVYRVGGGISSPRLLSSDDLTRRQSPHEPEGKVLVWAIVDITGRVRYPKIIKGLGTEEDKQALEAASHLHFAPASRDGVPVSIETNLTVTFSQ